MKSNFTSRLLTVLIGLPLIFCLSYLLPAYNFLALCIGITVLSFAATLEMSKMVFKENNYIGYFGFVFPVCFYLEGLLKPDFSLFSSIFILFLIVVLAKDIIKKDFSATIEHCAKNLLVLIYPSLFAGLFVKMLAIEGMTPEIVLTFFILVFSTEIFSYSAGKLFGKNNSGCFAASPKKSIAGFIGGNIMTVVSLFCCRAIFKFEINAFVCVAFALAVSVFANIGDLTESTFKRSVCKKDSSDIIPGRGGVLDCMDSVLFALPVFYIFAKAVLL